MRVWLTAAFSVTALALPGLASADLTVSGPSVLHARGATSIAIRPPVSATSLLVFVPRGFGASVDGSAGTRVGSGSATLQTGGSAAEASGDLTVAGEDAACGSNGHETVWRLSLGEGGELLVGVDAVEEPDPAAAYASYRLEVCPPTDALIAALELRLDDVFTTPDTAGGYAWRAVTTPSGPASGVESRSTQYLPVRIMLKGAFDRVSGRATLSGILTAAGSSVAGARIRFLAGHSGTSLGAAGSATTGSQGRFRLRRALLRTTVFEASAALPVRDDPAGCPEPIAPGGCTSATIAGASATSKRVTVRVPAPRTLRLGSRGADVRRLRADLVRLRYLPPGSGGATFDDRTWHAVVAFQGWLGLGRTGIVDRRTWRALGRARIPVPWAHLRHAVLVDTVRQVLLLVEGGRTVRAIHVSTGAYGRTPRGHFSVYRKEVLSWSVAFSTWMPYASYFVGGFAMHAYPSVPSYPASHGCVRVPPIEAPGVYRFAGYGTPVWVR